jgi:hypothetical protein
MCQSKENHMVEHKGASHDANHGVGSDGQHPGHGGQGEEGHNWAEHFAAQAHSTQTHKTPCSDAGSSRNGGSSIRTISDVNNTSVTISDGNLHSTEPIVKGPTEPPNPTEPINPTNPGEPSQPTNPGEPTNPSHDHGDHHHRARREDLDMPPIFVVPTGSIEIDGSPTGVIRQFEGGQANATVTKANSAATARATF